MPHALITMKSQEKDRFAHAKRVFPSNGHECGKFSGGMKREILCRKPQDAAL